MAAIFANMFAAIGKSGVSKGANAIVGMVKGVGDQVNSMMMGEGKGTIEGVMGLFQQLFNALNPFAPILQTMSQIFGVFGDIIAGKMAPVMEKLFAIFLSDSVIALIEKLGDAFVTLFDAFMPIIELLMKALMPVLDVVIGIIKFIADIVAWFVKTILTPVIDFLVNVFIAGFQGFLTAVMVIGTGIVNFFKGLINAIISIINFAITAINAVIEVLTLGFVKNAIPYIPKLDTGGDILGSGLAVVHKNEKVLNPAETELYSAMVGNNAGGGEVGGSGGITVNVYGTVWGIDDFMGKVEQAIASKQFNLR